MRFDPEEDGTKIPGSVSHRCGCSVHGRAATCPGAIEGHGSWAFVIRTANGQVRRAGYLTPWDAQLAGKAMWRLAHATGHQEERSASYRRARITILVEDVHAFQWPSAPASGSVVYVFEAGRYIKIGKSGNVRERLQTVRGKPSSTRRLIVPDACDPTMAKILLTHGGGFDAEQAVKHLLRNFHAAGEWFEAHPAVLAALRQIFTSDVALSA